LICLLSIVHTGIGLNVFLANRAGHVAGDRTFSTQTQVAAWQEQQLDLVCHANLASHICTQKTIIIAVYLMKKKNALYYLQGCHQQSV
jgi:hypothetical protein